MRECSGAAERRWLANPYLKLHLHAMTKLHRSQVDTAAMEIAAITNKYLALAHQALMSPIFRTLLLKQGTFLSA